MTISPASPTPFDSSLGYARNGLDRLSAQREDAVAMAALREQHDSLTAVFAGEQVVLDGMGRPWFALAEAAKIAPPRHVALLGRRDGRALFATAVDLDLAPEVMQGESNLKDLRTIAVEGVLPPEDIGALAQAKALFHWHRHHGFCANCGSPTASEAAGWRRACARCGTLHFPRTDPVVIMMAVDGERCLLGRQPRFPPGMYSCLAGFVEPGETVEDAVRRELAEESGIVAGAVTYLASQPWPFPASLMIGCLAQSMTTAITIDQDELEDARWFSRDEARAMLDGRHPAGLLCPQPMAIAHHLLRAWVYSQA